MHCLCRESLCRAVPLRETAHNGVPVHCETVRRFACAVRSVALPCRRCELLVITPPVRPGVSPLVACAGLAVSHQRGVLDLICLVAPCLCRALHCYTVAVLCLASLCRCFARHRYTFAVPVPATHRAALPCQSLAVLCRCFAKARIAAPEHRTLGFAIARSCIASFRL